MTSSIRIEITSDFACPWCYVGYKRLENALKTLCNPPEIHWHPFMIDRRTEPSGEPYLAYNERRWGSDGWVAGMKKSALADGCEFRNWGRQNPASVWANTLQPHRLLRLAKDRMDWRQLDRLHAGILHVYYEEGKNISEKGVLIEVALNFGFAEEELKAFFESDKYVEEIMNGNRKGLSGVPFFEIYNGNELMQTMSGAQSTQTWNKIFASVY